MSAARPTPSAKPPAPVGLPTSVETTAPGNVMRRMQLLLRPATTMSPVEGMTATPGGVLNLAFVPTASTNPATPTVPAKVVTTAPGYVMRRMMWLLLSAIMRPPVAGWKATPESVLKRALVPVPSAVPKVPQRPANLVTTPAGVTMRRQWLLWSVTMMLPSAGMTAIARGP